MTNTCTMDRIDPQIAWMAFERRDRTSDGQFVGAVVTTGIYCKPSCPARRPKRENVLFFPDGAAARAAGYRACLRCKPDEVARDRVAVDRALALMEGAEHMPKLEDLAAPVGYAPHQIGRAHVCTPVTNAPVVCCLLLDKKTDPLHTQICKK